MEKNDKNIYQRVLAVMEDVEYIQKGDKLVGNLYRYCSHDQVTGKLHPYFVKHGIVVIPTTKSLVQDGNRTTVCLEVSFINADKPEDLIKVEYWGYGVDAGDKGPGKAISYAFKYACLKMFCLETGDDPDHDQEVEHVPEELKKAEPQQNQPMTIEKFYDAIFNFIPFMNDPGFGSIKSMLEYMNTMTAKTSIPRIIEQASVSEKRLQDFCNSWVKWYTSKKP